jgi:hypothetical protein
MVIGIYFIPRGSSVVLVLALSSSADSICLLMRIAGCGMGVTALCRSGYGQDIACRRYVGAGAALRPRIIFFLMKNHRLVDQRSLALAEAVARKIDNDPNHSGLEKARSVCESWMQKNPGPSVLEWRSILEEPWTVVRKVLLDTTEHEASLRQSSPFCGVLTPRERWDIYRRFNREAA